MGLKNCKNHPDEQILWYDSCSTRSILIAHVIDDQQAFAGETCHILCPKRLRPWSLLWLSFHLVSPSFSSFLSQQQSSSCSHEMEEDGGWIDAHCFVNGSFQPTRMQETWVIGMGPREMVAKVDAVVQSVAANNQRTM